MATFFINVLNSKIALQKENLHPLAWAVTAASGVILAGAFLVASVALSSSSGVLVHPPGDPEPFGLTNSLGLVGSLLLQRDYPLTRDERSGIFALRYQKE